MDVSKRVLFYDDNHSYWLNGVKQRSVGVFLKSFFKDFDSKYWLTYKSIEHALGKDKFKSIKPRVFPYQDELNDLIKGLSKKGFKKYFNHRVWLAQHWIHKGTVAAFKGTRYHWEREMEFHAQGFSINPWDGKEYELKSYVDKSIADNYSQTDELYQLEDGFYTELVVGNKELGIFGQIDKCWIETIDNVRYVDYGDYKTNEEKPKTSGIYKAHYPLDELYDCAHNKYQVQISSYAYLMEIAGFTPRHLSYTWVKDYNPKSTTRVPVIYLRNEIKAMIDMIKKFN